MKLLNICVVMFIVVMGGLIALFGTYWDDAWHTDFGRDTFASPPHLMLYGGVTLAGFGVGLWGLLSFYRYRSLRAIMRNPPLLLAMIGIAATFVSAPVDDFWHTAFGRDAVLWSPPHLLGVITLLMVSVSILLESRRLSGRSGLLLTYAAGALVLATLLIPVMEYESDVPQFALAWYFPVLAFSSSLAFSLIKTISTTSWSGTITTIIYTGLRIAIVGFLVALNHSLPFVPPIVFLAIVVDCTFRVRWSLMTRTIILSVALYLIYIPYLNYVGANWGIEFADVITTIPVTLLAVYIPQALLVSRKYLSPSLIAILLVVSFLTFQPTAVSAHDPGQGEDIGQVHLIAIQQNSNVQISADLMDRPSCNQWVPSRIIARRAGDRVMAALQSTSDCHFEGSIQLPEPGRWFIYTNWTDGDQTLEAWLPVIAGSSTSSIEKAATIYKVAATSGSPQQVLAGIGIYLLNLLLLGGTILIVRRSPPLPNGAL